MPAKRATAKVAKPKKVEKPKLTAKKPATKPVAAKTAAKPIAAKPVAAKPHNCETCRGEGRGPQAAGPHQGPSLPRQTRTHCKHGGLCDASRPAHT